jgi:predicted RNase H-like nuclease (RuvC/YqgF family)
LKSKNDECEDLRKLNAELEFNIQELKHELQELIQLQNKVAMLSSEIERLKKKLDNRTEEVEVLK